MHEALRILGRFFECVKSIGFKRAKRALTQYNNINKRYDGYNVVNCMTFNALQLRSNNNMLRYHLLMVTAHNQYVCLYWGQYIDTGEFPEDEPDIKPEE